MSLVCVEVDVERLRTLSITASARIAPNATTSIVFELREMLLRMFPNPGSTKMLVLIGVDLKTIAFSSS